MNFGLVGCGMIATKYVEALAEIAGAQLVCAYDADPDRAVQFCREVGITACKTLEELLSSEIDAVCICTPSGFHTQQAILAAEAGKHIMCEKPIGITKCQLDSLRTALNKHAVTFTAVSQLHFSDGFQKVKQAIDQGGLGKLVLGDLSMKYFRNEQYYQSGGWRGTWEMDGGALMNQGIHGISLLLDLMGPVSSVTALTRTLAHNIEVEDTAAAVLEFQNGAIGTIVGATSVVPGYPRVLSVHGTKGSVCMREDAIAKWDIPGQEQQIGSVSDAKTFANSAAFSAQLHKRQIEDFITSVEKQTAPTVGFQQGRRAVELILAIYESSRTGKTIFMGREDENRVVE